MTVDPARIVWAEWDRRLAERELTRRRERQDLLARIISREAELAFLKLTPGRPLGSATLDRAVSEIVAQAGVAAAGLDVEHVFGEGRKWRQHHARLIAERVAGELSEDAA